MVRVARIPEGITSVNPANYVHGELPADTYKGDTHEGKIAGDGNYKSQPRAPVQDGAIQDDESKLGPAALEKHSTKAILKIRPPRSGSKVYRYSVSGGDHGGIKGDGRVLEHEEDEDKQCHKGGWNCVLRNDDLDHKQSHESEEPLSFTHRPLSAPTAVTATNRSHKTADTRGYRPKVSGSKRGMTIMQAMGEVPYQPHLTVQEEALSRAVMFSRSQRLLSGTRKDGDVSADSRTDKQASANAASGNASTFDSSASTENDMIAPSSSPSTDSDSVLSSPAIVRPMADDPRATIYFAPLPTRDRASLPHPSTNDRGTAEKNSFAESRAPTRQFVLKRPPATAFDSDDDSDLSDPSDVPRPPSSPSFPEEQPSPLARKPSRKSLRLQGPSCS